MHYWKFETGEISDTPINIMSGTGTIAFDVVFKDIFKDIWRHQRRAFMTDTRNYPNALPGVSHDHHDYLDVMYCRPMITEKVFGSKICIRNFIWKFQKGISKDWSDVNCVLMWFVLCYVGSHIGKLLIDIPKVINPVICPLVQCSIILPLLWQ